MLSFHCSSFGHLICVSVLDTRLISVLTSSFTCIACFSCHLCICHPHSSCTWSSLWVYYFLYCFPFMLHPSVSIMSSFNHLYLSSHCRVLVVLVQVELQTYLLSYYTGLLLLLALLLVGRVYSNSQQECYSW